MFRQFIVQIQRSVQSISYRLDSKQSKQIFSNESKPSMKFCLICYEPHAVLSYGIWWFEWYFWVWNSILVIFTHWFVLCLFSSSPLRSCVPVSRAVVEEQQAVQRREESKLLEGRESATETLLWPGPEGLLCSGEVGEWALSERRGFYST